MRYVTTRLPARRIRDVYGGDFAVRELRGDQNTVRYLKRTFLQGQNRDMYLEFYVRSSGIRRDLSNLPGTRVVWPKSAGMCVDQNGQLIRMRQRSIGLGRQHLSPRRWTGRCELSTALALQAAGMVRTWQPKVFIASLFITGCRSRSPLVGRLGAQQPFGGSSNNALLFTPLVDPPPPLSAKIRPPRVIRVQSFTTGAVMSTRFT